MIKYPCFPLILTVQMVHTASVSLLHGAIKFFTLSRLTVHFVGDALNVLCALSSIKVKKSNVEHCMIASVERIDRT